MVVACVGGLSEGERVSWEQPFCEHAYFFMLNSFGGVLCTKDRRKMEFQCAVCGDHIMFQDRARSFS